MRRWIEAVGVTLTVACGGCVTTAGSQLTETSPSPTRAAPFFALLPGLLVASDPAAPPAAPHSLRPCCAFGYGVRVQIGPLPVPGFRLANIASLDDLGEHTYDGGMISLDGDVTHGFVSREKNGIAYTCRGGFIDTAHVRDYADWTFFLSRQSVAMLDHGGRIELPREGGRRLVYVVAMDPDLVESVGKWNLAVELAQWLAFQLSIWHETATWYGWSALSLFPELASAFSPEDLYSNLFGIELAGAILREGGALSEKQYNEAMTRSLSHFLGELGAVPPDLTRLAAASIDKARGAKEGWWDSSRRLPAKSFVLRRNLDTGSRVAPWQVPPRKRSPELVDALQRACGREGEQPLVLQHPQRIRGAAIRDLVRLDIRVAEGIDPIFPLPKPPMRWIAQDDLTSVIEHVRASALAEFGAGSDAP